jgi:phosphatidate cytidylyltransferase
MARVVSGVVLAAVFFALVWFANSTVLLFVALGVAALAVHEYLQLFRALGAEMHPVPVFAATWATIANVAFPTVALELLLAVVLVVTATWVMARLKPGPATGDGSVVGPGFSPAILGAAASMLATVYIGIGLGSLVAVHVWGGRGAVILLITTIVVSDTAQYYAGRTFGRRPLAPKLSPKKTIEGAIGGFVIAPAFLVFSAYYFVPAASSPLSLVVLAIALVVAGIAGDLFESTLKRAAGVKDSSALIPGHGGVLDRIDALLFASPIFYLYLRWLFS